MNKQIDISVVMSAYNAETYISEAIESILNQTFGNFEFIIINDGSSDRTLQIIQKYQKIDTRIRLISRENKGLIASLNEGVDTATGEYIARMDADDISLAMRFQEQFEFMKKNKDVMVCGSWIKHFGEENYIRKYPSVDDDIRAFFIFRSPLAHPSTMINAKILKAIKYNKNYIHAEDYKLWSEIMKHGKVYNIPKVLLNYRITAEQITSKYGDISVEASKKIRREYINDFFASKGLELIVPSNILLNDIKDIQIVSNISPKIMNTIRESYYLSLEKYSLRSLFYFLISLDYINYPYKLKDFLRIIRCHITKNKDKWL